jgi:hypothetical protein
LLAGSWRIDGARYLCSDCAPPFTLATPDLQAQLVASEAQRQGLVLQILKDTEETALLKARYQARVKELEDALRDIADYYGREYVEGDKAYQALIVARKALASTQAEG